MTKNKSSFMIRNLSEQIKDKLRVVAAIEKTSMNKIIIKAVETYTKQIETDYTLIKGDKNNEQ